MKNVVRIAVISRRSFLLSAAATLAVASTAGALLQGNAAMAGGAVPSNLERTKWFEDELSKLLAGATPAEGKITLELPEIAENGNFVPVTISVDNPMTAEDHVKTIHLLSTSNPVARIATFHLSPLNGLARVQSRIRLSKTQDVVALAELSNGTIEIATLLVKVTIGGCGS